MQSKTYPPPRDLISFKESNPYLTVDTSLFPASFQTALLAELSNHLNLDDATDGVLIHADNFQALNLLQARYHGQVKCIYIDPPYNTGGDGFIYKDGYQRSSWATLIHNRLSLAKPLLSQSGVIFQSIDDNEQANLKLISDDVFGSKNQLGTLIQIKGNAQNDAINIQKNHEYILSYSKQDNEIAVLSQNSVSEEEVFNDKFGFYYLGAGLVTGGEGGTLNNRPNLGYTIYFHPKTLDFLAVNDYDKNMATVSNDESLVYSDDEALLQQGYKKIRPPKKGNLLGCWTWGFDGFNEKKHLINISESRNGFSVKKKEYVADDIVSKRAGKFFAAITKKTNIRSILDFKTAAGTKILNNLLGEKKFQNPKNISMISTLIAAPSNSDDLILDYFAGSGTTAHAVINLNREDGGKRKYILVEQGEYFDTVLKPRVQKVVYAKDWKDGKPEADKGSGSLHGVSQIVKVLKLESYEDTLNNLVLKDNGDLFGRLPENVKEDYLLRYLLDDQSKGSLLNTDVFRRPFDYQMDIATSSAGATETVNIDLVETFNYLLGIRVAGIKNHIAEGYLLVEGVSPNNRYGDIDTLVIWRDCERIGYDKLAQILEKERITPKDSEYDTVYINGDHNIATVWESENGVSDSLKIRQIESEFLALMFGEEA